MFNNDERYWDIGLLNKWFAISSIIFLAVTIWVFVDDNDDEFKDYQRNFGRWKLKLLKKLLDRAAEIEVEKQVMKKISLALKKNLILEKKN